MFGGMPFHMLTSILQRTEPRGANGHDLSCTTAFHAKNWMRVRALWCIAFRSVWNHRAAMSGSVRLAIGPGHCCGRVAPDIVSASQHTSNAALVTTVSSCAQLREAGSSSARLFWCAAPPCLGWTGSAITSLALQSLRPCGTTVLNAARSFELPMNRALVKARSTT